MFDQGTVVLVPFPFTDLSAQKVRPALIISYRHTGDDMVVAFISSKKYQKTPAFGIVVKQSSPSFTKTGLKIDSVVLTDKLATLDKKIILGKLGTADALIMQAVKQKIRTLFRV